MITTLGDLDSKLIFRFPVMLLGFFMIGQRVVDIIVESWEACWSCCTSFWLFLLKLTLYLVKEKLLVENSFLGFLREHLVHHFLLFWSLFSLNCCHCVNHSTCYRDQRIFSVTERLKAVTQIFHDFEVLSYGLNLFHCILAEFCRRLGLPHWYRGHTGGDWMVFSNFWRLLFLKATCREVRICLIGV